MPMPPIVLHPYGDDEAARMIAVSRQRRQRHTNTRGSTVRQSQPSTSLPLQDTDVLQSQLWSAHTHTHTCSRTHTKLAANVHTLAPAQSDDLAAALHYSTTTIVLCCCLQWALLQTKRRREQGRRRESAEVVKSATQNLSPPYSTVSIKRAFDIR